MTFSLNWKYEYISALKYNLKAKSVSLDKVRYFILQ